MRKGISQGLVSRLVLLNIFVGDIDSGMEFTLRQFVKDTKPRVTVDTLKGWDTIQRDPDRLAKQPV